jgi:hypothetical protein
VSTHINVVLPSFPSGEQKRLMNTVHANKYKLLISSEIGSDYVMRYLLRLLLGG